MSEIALKSRELSKIMSIEFGRRLKMERERLGFTQPVFAELGGVKRATQHLYEQAVTAPDVDYLLRLDTAGVDLLFLLFGELKRGIGSAGINVSPEVLSQIFRTVDDFATDEAGKALSPAVREKFFLMLTAAVLQGGSNASAIRIHKEMVRLLGRAA